jgi:hypothetical protein
VGNTKPRPEGEVVDAAGGWDVGPFYGRLFREVTAAGRATKTRYFGYIEESVRIGEDDETGKCILR